jgi:multiple sugar transport system permease protein
MIDTQPAERLASKRAHRPLLSLGTRDRLFGVALLLPAFVALGLVVGYPLYYSIRLSFYEQILTKPAAVLPFVGLRNYETVLRDGLFLQTWANTFVYVFVSTFLAFIIGFGLALLLNRPLLGRAAFRSLFLVPWLVPSVAASLLWQLLLSPNYGGVNLALLELGILKDMPAWFGSMQLAMPSVIAVNVWRTFPFMMVMLLAALQTVPIDLIEAARIDGAGRLQVLRYVVVPYIRGIITIVTLVSVIWNFQQFTVIWVPTKGGPANATTTLAIQLYKTAFEAFDFGRAAAMGTLWLVFLVVFSVVYVRLLGGRD